MFPVVRRTLVIGILFWAFVCFWPAVNKDHAGPTKVIDANTLEVKGERHRLYGLIDARDACRKWRKDAQACPQQAATALTDFLHGRQAYCQVIQKLGEKNFSSVCYVEHDDINVWMAENGWAMADRTSNRLYRYENQEGMARLEVKGFWKGFLLSDKLAP